MFYPPGPRLVPATSNGEASSWVRPPGNAPPARCARIHSKVCPSKRYVSSTSWPCVFSGQRPSWYRRLSGCPVRAWFPDIARALGVHALALACVSDADFIPTRDMKDAIHALHWLAQALLLGDIALVRSSHSAQTARWPWRDCARESHTSCPASSS
jgi:hypothetical protein